MRGVLVVRERASGMGDGGAREGGEGTREGTNERTNGRMDVDADPQEGGESQKKEAVGRKKSVAEQSQRRGKGERRREGERGKERKLWKLLLRRRWGVRGREVIASTQRAKQSKAEPAQQNIPIPIREASESGVGRGFKTLRRDWHARARAIDYVSRMFRLEPPLACMHRVHPGSQAASQKAGQPPADRLTGSRAS